MKNNKPLISVIVPVYNAEKSLCKCIDSILAQTYSNLEIVLVDDGSPDGCPAICDKYTARDSRIKVIHQENKGVANARNTGLDNITGEFLCFVDSDDYIDDNYIEAFYNYIDEETDVIVSMCKYISSDNTLLELLVSPEQITVVSVDENINICQSQSNNSVWAKLIRKELVFNNCIRFPEDIYLGEDAVFVAECILNSRIIKYIPNPTYNYVLYDESLCHGKLNQKKLTYLNAWEKICELCNDTPKSKSVAAHQLISICLFLYRQSFVESNAHSSLNEQVYSKIISANYREYFAVSSGNLKYRIKYFLLTNYRLVYDALLKLKFWRQIKGFIHHDK